MADTNSPMKTQFVSKMVCLLAIFAFPATCLVAEPMGPEEREGPPPFPSMEQLKRSLGLNDEQSAKLESLLTDAQKKEWIRLAGSRPPGQGFCRNPMLGRMPQGHLGMLPGRPEGEPGHGPCELMPLLQLSGEQKEKVREIFETNKPKMDAVRNEANAKIQEIRTAIDSQIRPLLSKQQQSVFDDISNLDKAQEALFKDSEALRGTN